MVGIVIALSLIASLLLVHVSMRTQPMPRARPLDVDGGLPLPEIGQASTVFSLTALFGAYLGIHLLLGLTAVFGLAAGTVSGLIVVRRWILRTRCSSFDEYLYGLTGRHRSNAPILVLGLSLMQCVYAASELVILRSVVDTSLGARSDQAVLLVVAVGLIAYFYVLFGGYLAVFRTDVMQFVFVGVMGVVLMFAQERQLKFDVSAVSALARPGYWPLPLEVPRVVLETYHALVGFVMGLSFMIASPDAWKRVFLVTISSRQPRRRFALFVVAGTVPFLFLLPVGLNIPPVPDGAIDVAALWNGVIANDAAFVAVSLGLISSFLSAFNGALLSSVHLGLVMRRRLHRTRNEMPRFHWLMVSALLTTFLVFAAFRSTENPYVLANLLIGPYAVLSALCVATAGGMREMRQGSALWVVVLGCTAWLIYFADAVGFPASPTTFQINTVPGGVALFVGTTLVSSLLLRRTAIDA